MMLREKRRSTKMTKYESITSYLTRITWIRNELGAMRETVDDCELVRTALNGVRKPWEVFLEGIVGQ